MVLAGQIGVYREVPPRHVGQPGWRFDPLLNSTFYRITQGEQVRSAGDLDVAPLHAPQWVLRTAKPASVQPQLRLSWQPGTVVLLGNGNVPYLLAVGRERAAPAASSIEQVAPGFSEAELQKLEYAKVGPVREQAGSGARDQATELAAASAAQRRLMVLWGVLLLGVAALGFMVWRLIRSSRSLPPAS